MSTTDPDITFDAAGRCNHCTDYLDRLANLTYKPGTSDRELAAIVERIKAAGRGKEYDCVIGVSGGIDSCYAAYVVKSHGLRPLVVHMDNGWNSDTAVKNIKNVARTLGIDYQSVVLDWEEFRDLQLAFLRASVPEIETPTDIAIPAALHRVAAENGVRFIIMGGNYATEGILPRAWHYNAKDVRFLKAVHRRFGSGKLGTFPTFGFVKETYYKFFKRIRLVYVLNLVPYSKNEAMKKLQEELGWEYYGGKHYESKITGFVQSYILPVKFQIDYRRATLSSQICAGEITREEALEILKGPPFDAARVPEEKEYVAKKFGITLEEMDAILAAPPRTHRDYPNNERYLELVSGCTAGSRRGRAGGTSRAAGPDHRVLLPTDRRHWQHPGGVVREVAAGVRWEATVLAPAETPHPADRSLDIDGGTSRADPNFGGSSVAWAARRRGVGAPQEWQHHASGVSRPMPSRWLRRVAKQMIFPDTQIGWYPAAAAGGKRLLRERPFDLIYSSAFPVTSHLVARTLRRGGHPSPGWPSIGTPGAMIRSLGGSSRLQPFGSSARSRGGQHAS